MRRLRGAEVGGSPLQHTSLARPSATPPVWSDGMIPAQVCTQHVRAPKLVMEKSDSILPKISAALETRWSKCEDRWRRTQIFSIRAASLPLDGIEQNSIYKWPLNGCIYQIIAACRFHKLRLIRTSVEKYNKITVVEWEARDVLCWMSIIQSDWFGVGTGFLFLFI